MKKIAVLAVVFVFLSAVLPSFADSVWTPMDDYFFDAWSPESDNTCKSQERVYYMAAGEKGYVTAVKTPIDRTVLAVYPNGSEFMIAFVCGKGDSLWGAVQAVRKPNEKTFKEDWTGESGYISFGDLVRSYDSDAFIEDHQNELRPYSEADYDFCSGGDFVLWSAPNSGVQLEYVTSDYIHYMCMDYSPDTDYKMFHYGSFYQDPDGNRWLEIRLRRVTERGWICLDHLTDGGEKPEY